MAWTSYKASYSGDGLLQFYMSPSGRNIFNKDYISFGFGSNASAAMGQCRRDISSSFNPLSATLTVNIKLCDSPPCQENPCPGVLAPEATG